MISDPTIGDAEIARMTLEEIKLAARVCRRCPLCESRTLAVPGEGPVGATVMFVGEAPGKHEDESGLPFQGNAGRVFDKLLEQSGLMRAEVFITGAVKCRPPENRDPKAGEIDACNPYLRRQIELVQPRIICALGRHGLSAVLGRKAVLTEWRGRFAEFEGRTLTATYHPAAAFYRQELKQAMQEDMRRLGEWARSALAARI